MKVELPGGNSLHHLVPDLSIIALEADGHVARLTMPGSRPFSSTTGHPAGLHQPGGLGEEVVAFLALAIRARIPVG